MHIGGACSKLVARTFAPSSGGHSVSPLMAVVSATDEVAPSPSVESEPHPVRASRAAAARAAVRRVMAGV